MQSRPDTPHSDETTKPSDKATKPDHERKGNGNKLIINK